MYKKLTSEEFIKRSKKIHGNEFNYSKVDYKTSKIKVIIICKVHGEFLQRPNSHLRGDKCRKCQSLINSIKSRSTTKEFIKRSKLIHGNKYDYNDVEYIGVHFNVNIICKKHGNFSQPPHTHLRGNGCPKCGTIDGVNNQKITNDAFIKKLKSIHGNKYDYSKVIYVDYQTNIKIICKVHGEFSQRPSVHLVGNGCVKCSRIISANTQKCSDDDFIKKSKKIHGNKYNYYKMQYKNAHSKIDIICSKHGIFSQTPSSHLKGSGCPVCNSSKGELIINEYLVKNNIKFNNEYKFEGCINPETKRRLEFDFYLPDYNTCIEYDGAQHYESINFFGGENGLITNKIRDKIKTKYCKNKGIELIRIPYWEYKNISKILDINILNLRTL